MSFYNSNQKNRPQTPFVEETGSDSEKLATPIFRCQTLIKSGSDWFYKDHVTGAPVAITNGQYDPAFRVRVLSIVGSAAANVHFDLPITNDIIESLTPGVDKCFHVTRVHLDAFTTATRINLFG